jgi:hypothetical protein
MASPAGAANTGMTKSSAKPDNLNANAFANDQGRATNDE